MHYLHGTLRVLLLLLVCSAGLSCGTGNRQWADDKQKAFMDLCQQAVSDIMDRPESAEYCGCILDQLIEAYPDSLTINELPQETFDTFADHCTR